MARGRKGLLDFLYYVNNPFTTMYTAVKSIAYHLLSYTLHYDEEEMESRDSRMLYI